MFSSAFSGAFRGRRFGGAFAGAFVHRVAGCIGPMMAQAALVAGARWHVRGSSVVVGGKLLIGPAGKVFVFATPQTAARWVDNAKTIGLREAALIPTIAPETAAAWKAKKRAKLAVIAGRVVNAAARVSDAERQAALIAEAGYCLTKWG